MFLNLAKPNWRNSVWKVTKDTLSFLARPTFKGFVAKGKILVSKAKPCLVAIKCYIGSKISGVLEELSTHAMHEGVIVRTLDWLFRLLRLFSLLSWLRASLNEKSCYKSEFGKYRLVEEYVIGWIVFEISVVIFLTIMAINDCYSWANWFMILLYVLFGLRLIDMFQASLNLTIFNPKQNTKQDKENISDGFVYPRRSLILNLVNLAEVVLIFGIFTFLNRAAYYPAFVSPLDSIHYSISTFTLLGNPVEVITRIGQVFLISEVIIGFTYSILILGHMVSLLSRSLNRNGENDGG